VSKPSCCELVFQNKYAAARFRATCGTVFFFHGEGFFKDQNKYAAARFRARAKQVRCS
jgi:hypothetical protein